LKGLSFNGGHYIHISGMDVLLDPSLQTGSHSPVQVFDDLDGIEKLRLLPGTHILAMQCLTHQLIAFADGSPHREVDKLVLAAGTDLVKTAILCPSTVHELGSGPVSQRSDQVPKLTQLMVQAGHGVELGVGKAFWSYIHIYDLSRLCLLLVDKVVRIKG
jgi:hypothetical protein